MLGAINGVIHVLPKFPNRPAKIFRWSERGPVMSILIQSYPTIRPHGKRRIFKPFVPTIGRQGLVPARFTVSGLEPHEELKLNGKSPFIRLELPSSLWASMSMLPKTERFCLRVIVIFESGGWAQRTWKVWFQMRPCSRVVLATFLPSSFMVT
ncbi:nucleotide-diphospho-sugar transferase superfamily protein [Striga asiatica]|uniref:Nucleotide-diphospho-sugar transferase superfamily protein n=1 Tax=Striga asiatica TaxID=4170 RepID=A0A5A7R739_STRAF|nr:nucleotide-diphospho-sugar transferase superfamily protein [Striga asiatica]